VPRVPGQYRRALTQLRARKLLPARVPHWLFASVGYVIAFVAVTWPLALNFTHATWGGIGDGWALIWQTRFRLENGLSYFSPTFGHDIGWPVGGELTSSLLLSNAAVELPNVALLALGVGDVPAYNLIVFTAAITSSLAMYAVLRRLGCRPGVAFWGGLVYLLAPWHLVKLSIHPTLGAMAALPLLLLGILEWTRRPGWRSGALVVASFALATYTHSYFGLAAAMTLIAALPLALVAAYWRGTLGRMLPETAVLGGVLALVPIPLAVALARQSSEVSLLLDRTIHVFELAASPRYLLLPSVDNPLFGDISRGYLQTRGQLNEGELALYVGMLTLVLAVVAVVAAIRFAGQRLATAVAATVAVAGLVFAAPAVVRIPALDIAITMPVAYLNQYVSFISTPARFFALTLTGVVVLAALGLQFLTTKVPNALGLGLVVIACVISAMELPFRRENMLAETGPTPLVKAIKRNVPEGEPVAQYPSAESFYVPMARQLFYQLHHHRPLLNGAQATSLEDSVRLGLEDPFDPALPGKLALMGYRFAAYDLGQAIERAAVIGRPVTEALTWAPQKGFEVLERTKTGDTLMRVVAEPASSFVTIGTGFTRVGRWVTSERATLLGCATAPGVHRLHFKASSFAGDRWFRIGDGELIVLPSGTEEKEIVTRVRLQPGWQLLPIQLIGSKPTRPSDVIRGEPDTRPLAVSIGPISVRGPRGSSRHCSRPTRLDDVPMRPQDNLGFSRR
jgi:hypothetical protein